MKHYHADEWRASLEATVEAMLAGAADMQVIRNDLDELGELEHLSSAARDCH